MIRLRYTPSFLLLLLLLLFTIPATGAETPSASVTIGYVEIEGDPRYQQDSAYAGIVFRTLGRAFPGAQVGLDDARTIGRVIDTEFTLRRTRAGSVDDLADTVADWAEKGIGFVLADLPAEQLLELADASTHLPVLFFNVSAPDNLLREEECRRNIAHTYPSYSMLTDALAQYLVAQKWRSSLVLRGPTKADAKFSDSFRRSAKIYGIEITDERPFVLSNHPSDRDKNDVTLLTGRASYDTVFVADSRGEFGRYVPYRSVLPRPVVGSVGLVPRAWHWSWHRHGAAQLQHRFEALAMPRRMNGQAWAAWVAVRAITQAALRADSDGFMDMRRFILGDELNLDGAKGNPTSFRMWNHQLRQPLLLATPNAVIARAPLPGFLHRTNVLDTLGRDAPESACAFSE